MPPLRHRPTGTRAAALLALSLAAASPLVAQQPTTPSPTPSPAPSTPAPGAPAPGAPAPAITPAAQPAQPAPPPANPADVASIESIVAAVYDVISGPAGQKRDWKRFESLFHPSARLVPTGRRRADDARVARAITPQQYVEGNAAALETDGFFEKEIARTVDQFGPIAHVFSTYETRRASSDPTPFMRGINSIQLFNDGTRWWVMSIYWAQEGADNPIPAKYLPR